MINGGTEEAAGHALSGANPVLGIGADTNNDGNNDFRSAQSGQIQNEEQYTSAQWAILC